MDFQQARHNMIEQQVRPWSVTDTRVLQVMQEISREMFVPPQYANLAYSDTDIPLSEGQTMLAPKVVGRALQALNIQASDTVLEIGTGTGYITACLGRLATQVISIEIFETLLSLAQRKLSGNRELEHILLKQGNGLEGYAPQAPYDAIFITGSLPLGVPEILCQQLKEKGGRLFAFCGEAPAMQAILIERNQNNFVTHSLFETAVPALLHAAQPEKFVF